MTQHELHSSPETVHWGFFDAALPPRLRIKSGDTVTVHCVSGGPNAMPSPPFEIPPELSAIHAQLQPRLPGHILTGPNHVDGAMPGDSLEIEVLDIKFRTNWGWNMQRPLAGTLPEVVTERCAEIARGQTVDDSRIFSDATDARHGTWF